jgi:hypothetical protein
MGRWHWISGPPTQDLLTGLAVSMSFIVPLFGCAWVADFAGLCQKLPSYLVETV